jgi:hypothetical protein
VAVLPIFATDLYGGSDDTSPYRNCGSSRDGLPPRRLLALRRELLSPLFDDLFYLARVHVASQFGMYYSRMHCGGTYAAVPMAFVECDRKEDVRRFESAISDERPIGRALKVMILKVDIGMAVTQQRLVSRPLD